MATRGFIGKRRPFDDMARTPPGQTLTEDFPVLSAGPTQHIDPARWSFTLKVGPRPVKRWTWAEINALPQTSVRVDLHCVTRWSKLETSWQGVTVDTLLEAANLTPPTDFVLANSFDDYSTNVPVADLVGGKAMVALRYRGDAISADHGGPARLLVPHLYLWKSAKWLSGLQFTEKNEAGFWELRGYHMRGDPWREERFRDDE